jgi:hypothetical protein
MENASAIKLPIRLERMIAEQIVDVWVKGHKIYLLDGDPRILHPIAREALVKVIDKELVAMRKGDETTIQSDGKVKTRKKGKDRPADG